MVKSNSYWNALPADRVHGARRGNELGGVDLMADPLVFYGPAHGLRDRLIRAAIAEQRAYIGLLDREQAVTELSVGRQADAVAVEAEGAADRRDEADPPDAVGEFVLGGRSARIGVRNLAQRADLAREHLDHIVGQQDPAAIPQPLGVERHELDVANLDATLAPEARQRHDVRLDQLLDGHCVDLEDRKSTRLNSSHPSISYAVFC